jgi:hypothetical protein
MVMSLCVLTKVAFKKIVIYDYGESVNYITKLTFKNYQILNSTQANFH